jgi:hypothetical protein
MNRRSPLLRAIPAYGVVRHDSSVMDALSLECSRPGVNRWGSSQVRRPARCSGACRNVEGLQLRARRLEGIAYRIGWY